MQPIDYVKALTFVRRGGSEQELKAAKLISSWLSEMGYKPKLEHFHIYDAVVKAGKLALVGSGKEFPVMPVGLSRSGDVEGKLTIVHAPEPELVDKNSLRNMIVLTSNPPRRKWLKLFVEAGAKAVLVVVANHREKAVMMLSQALAEDLGKKIMVGSIAYKHAIKLIEEEPESVSLSLHHEVKLSESQNVIAELPGESERLVVLTAHYDSTPCSPGAQDNAAGTAELLEVAKKLFDKRFFRRVRFVFCGSEEKGLLGSKAHVALHAYELEKMDLVVNLDVGGNPFVRIFAKTIGTDELKSFVKAALFEHGIPAEVKMETYSSDGMPFSRYGVPSVSLGRGGVEYKAHSPYDTPDAVCNVALVEIANAAQVLVEKVANARLLPFERRISDDMRKKVEDYFQQR